MLEDTAALMGLAVAMLGIYLSDALGLPFLDGVASVLIGCILAAVAVILSIECKGLLIGEATSRDTLENIENIIKSEKSVLALNELLSMHLGPQDILITMSVDFIDGLMAEDLEQITSDLEKQIKKAHPFVKRLFIEAQSAAGHLESVTDN